MEQIKRGEHRPKLEAARLKRGIGHVANLSDEDEYTLAISRAVDSLRRPREETVPSMPVVSPTIKNALGTPLNIQQESIWSKFQILHF